MRRALPGHFTASLSPHAGRYGMGACIPLGECDSEHMPVASPPPAPPGRVRPVLQATVISHSGFLPGPCPPGMMCAGPIGRMTSVDAAPEDAFDFDGRTLYWDWETSEFVDVTTGERFDDLYDVTGEEYPRTEISPESEYLEELRDDEDFERRRPRARAKLLGLALLLLVGIRVGTGRWFGK